MNDKELIEALKAEGKKSGVNTPTNRAWRRLSELTQPQPIETAPDGEWIRAYGGKLFNPFCCSGEHSDNDTRGIDARFVKFTNTFVTSGKLVFSTPPTHWLPCVQVDLSALEGKGDGQ